MDLCVDTVDDWRWKGERVCCGLHWICWCVKEGVHCTCTLQTPHFTVIMSLHKSVTPKKYEYDVTYTFLWYYMSWNAGLLFDKQFIDRHCRLWVDRRSVVGIFVVGFELPDEVTSSLKNVWRCRSLIVGVKTTGPQYIRMKRKRLTRESLALVSVNCQRQVCHFRLLVVECCLVTYCICADCCGLAVGYGCRLSLSFIATGCWFSSVGCLASVTDSDDCCRRSSVPSSGAAGANPLHCTY
jgi:hypothetical protein